jgi:proton glutamate symport protein
MFKMTNLVMKFAPFGVGAAMAHTIASQGPQVLVSLGYLIFTFYFAIIVFVVVVIGTVMLIARVPVRQFIRAVREPAAIAFATTTSEAAMPKAMEAMERLGVPNRTVSFVMPTGYSFNLDGSMIFLAVASVFVAQAVETTTGQHMSFGQQIMMMLTFMVTSKGIAGVPRSSILVLLATLGHILPPNIAAIGVAILLGIDAIMDMGRSLMNVVGNALATVVIARWEGEFDDNRAKLFGTLEEPPLNISNVQQMSRAG